MMRPTLEEEYKMALEAKDAEIERLTIRADCAEGHRAMLEADNEKLRAALPFFRSVILSGEPWTETCEQRYRAALEERK